MVRRHVSHERFRTSSSLLWEHCCLVSLRPRWYASARTRKGEELDFNGKLLGHGVAETAGCFCVEWMVPCPRLGLPHFRATMVVKNCATFVSDLRQNMGHLQRPPRASANYFGCSFTLTCGSTSAGKWAPTTAAPLKLVPYETDVFPNKPTTARCSPKTSDIWRLSANERNLRASYVPAYRPLRTLKAVTDCSAATARPARPALPNIRDNTDRTSAKNVEYLQSNMWFSPAQRPSSGQLGI